MTNVFPFPGRRRIREEASSWLVSLEEGLSATEREQLQNWLGKDPVHGRVLIEQARLWDDLDVLSELSGIYALESYRSQKKAGNFRTAAVAAGIAFLMVIGWRVAVELETTSVDSPSSAKSTAVQAPLGAEIPKEYRTTIGEQLSVRLPDGSVVSLNTDTQLSVQYSEDDRLVYLLRGEAQFDVAHDASRPFRVNAGVRQFEALGTVFNVQRIAGGPLELVVTEGRVRVHHTIPEDSGIVGPSFNTQPVPDRDLTVSAGQSISILETSTNQRTLGQADLDARLAWKRGMLIFRGEPLEQALREVERYTLVRFVLADEKLAKVPVGGYFRTGDVDGVMLALRETFGIKTKQVNETQVELSMK